MALNAISFLVYNMLTTSLSITTTIFMRWQKNDVENQHIVTYSHTKFHQSSLNSCYIRISMFMQHFDYFHYDRNHNFCVMVQ